MSDDEDEEKVSEDDEGSGEGCREVNLTDAPDEAVRDAAPIAGRRSAGGNRLKERGPL